MKIKIPDEIVVAGHVYKVIRNYKFTETTHLLAQADQHLNEIRLSEQAMNCSESRLWEIFLHEVIHCIDNNYNAQGLREEDVERLAEGLLQVLRTNDIVEV